MSVHLDEIHDLKGLSKLTDAYLTSGSHRKARAASQEVVRQAQSRGEMRSRRKATGVAWVYSRKHGNSEDAKSLFDDVLEISDALEDEDEGKDVGRHRRDWAAVTKPELAEGARREARNIFCRLGNSKETLRRDRKLIGHTYEHALDPIRYSQAI